jgi:hypothetical protein
MRRIQIYMDEVLDDRLEQEAAATGTSKAALIRACVAQHYAEQHTPTDPLDALVGRFEGEPVDDIDDVIYG